MEEQKKRIHDKPSGITGKPAEEDIVNAITRFLKKGNSLTGIPLALREDARKVSKKNPDV